MGKVVFRRVHPRWSGTREERAAPRASAQREKTFSLGSQGPPGRGENKNSGKLG